MDEIDRASDFEDKLLAETIAHAAVVVPAAQATGKCLNCGKRVRKGMRWCDTDCRDDWQARSKQGYK